MRAHTRLLSRFLLAAAAVVGLPASSALAQPSAVHVTQVSALRLLPGDWLGPFPGAVGRCVRGEYLEWFIYRTGSYTSTWNTYPQYRTNGCGGATAYGRWSTRGDVITFHQQSVPSCAECAQKTNIPVYYHFVTVNALRFCDYPDAADGCWLYYRQKS